MSIAFPAVAKGAQVLSGFAYSAASVTFGSAAPAVTAPGGAQGALSYAATPATVCMVNPASGALTLVGVGACVVTATAAGTPDYDAATAMFTVEVQAAGTLVLNLDAIAVGGTVNIAEKASGFEISGDTGTEAGVSVTVTIGGTPLSATSADANGTATWSVSVPGGASYIAGTSLDLSVSASKAGFSAPDAVARTLAVDLVAPTAPAYTAPGSLQVGVAIASMSPSGGGGIDGYGATGLPSGLVIDAASGVIGGTPDTAGNASTATVTVSDAAGNTAAPVSIAFPAVAKGAQVLSGFAYSAASVTFGSAAPTVTAPGGVETTLSYTATPADVCTVEASTGALTLAGGELRGHGDGGGHGRLRGGERDLQRRGSGGGFSGSERRCHCDRRRGEHRGEGVGVRDLGRHRDRGRGERHGDDRRHAPERDLGRRQRDGDLVGARAGGCGVHHGYEPRPVGVGFEGRV